jgi:hypothetical protein
MEIEIQKFNEAANELQQTEFRNPRTPGEWQRMRTDPPKREYAKLLGAVAPFIEAYVAASPGERSSVAARLSEDALGTLRTFAQSAAVLSVRRNLPPLIAQGLAALSILGEIDDPRDLLFYLATLLYSALKLGIDAQALFAEVALLCPGPFRDWMRGFPLLPTRANDLSAFKLRETTSTEGFDIVQDPS